jgi:hypothetical protein
MIYFKNSSVISAINTALKNEQKKIQEKFSFGLSYSH